MNLYLINNSQYVVADGPAGALYLSGHKIIKNMTKCVKMGIAWDDKPRKVSVAEAIKIIGVMDKAVKAIKR